MASYLEQLVRISFCPFFVLKPLSLLLFLVIWNAAMGLAIWLNGGMGPMTNPLGYIGVALSGAFAVLFGFGPFYSKSFLNRWYKEDAISQKNQLGLVFWGIIGAAFIFKATLEILLYLFESPS